MPAGIEFTVTGGKRAAKALREFADKADNLEAIAPQVHQQLISDHWAVFETQGRHIGENWPGYTGQEALYGFIKSKMLGINENRLLRWEPGRERLFPSVVSPTHPEHVWRVKDGAFEFGTSVPYAKNHQEGSGRGPAWAGFPKIKQRRFLGLTRRTAAKITRLIRSHMGLGAD
jgi:hypothetical protein